MRFLDCRKEANRKRRFERAPIDQSMEDPLAQLVMRDTTFVQHPVWNEYVWNPSAPECRGCQGSNWIPDAVHYCEGRPWVQCANSPIDAEGVKGLPDEPRRASSSPRAACMEFGLRRSTVDYGGMASGCLEPMHQPDCRDGGAARRWIEVGNDLHDVQALGQLCPRTAGGVAQRAEPAGNPGVWAPVVARRRFDFRLTRYLVHRISSAVSSMALISGCMP